MFQSDAIAQAPCLSISVAGVDPSGFSIERLGSDHRNVVEALLLALDAESRKSRFGGVTCDAGIRSHALRASNQATMLLGAFTGKRLCGLLEAYACNADDVEVALAVESGLRRQGIGWSLLRAAIEQGALTGMARLQLIFAADNWAMRRIAQKAEARLDLVFGQMCANIDLYCDPETDVSLIEWVTARELLGN
jgi:ribosomal protein S18 acetylase RimI-like enzyme